jgi:hypothetical protein
MGYRTDIYTRLENEDGTDASEEDVIDFQQKFEDSTEEYLNRFDYYFMGNLFQLCNEDDMKWYDKDEDFSILSKRFPDLVITVLGFGEDTQDMWYSHFKNGIVIGPHTIQITYTPYGNRQP